MTDYSYIGSGKIYVREYGAAAGRKEIGNCSRLSLSVSEESKKLLDHTQPGGGTYNEVRRIQAVEATIVMHDLSPDNFARALFGTANAVSAGSVTDEVVTAYLGSFVPFARVPSGSIVVTDSGGSTTYVANTDYEVVPGGINILSGGSITNAQSLKVDYAYAIQDRVEALINAAKDYEVIAVIQNEARSGKVVTIRMHRMKIGAAREVSLIGDDHAALEVSGELQKDTAITTGGLSQYAAIALVA